MDDVSDKKAFTQEEKKLLVNLVKSEPIIQDTRSDKATNKLKSDAWLRICDAYNSHGFEFKLDAEQLKSCWDKIKRPTKEAQSRLSTGGDSPSPEADIGPVEEVPHLIEPIPDVFDSDAIYELEKKLQGKSSENSSPPFHCSQELCSDSDDSGLDMNVQVMTMQNTIEKLQHRQDLYNLRRSILELKREQEIIKLRFLKRKRKLEETLGEEQRSLTKYMTTSDTSSVHSDTTSDSL